MKLNLYSPYIYNFLKVVNIMLHQLQQKADEAYLQVSKDLIAAAAKYTCSHWERWRDEANMAKF